MQRRNSREIEEENAQLLTKIRGLELELQREKAEKRIFLKIHREEMKFRDRREMMVFCVVAACVLIYACIAIVIRGFI